MGRAYPLAHECRDLIQGGACRNAQICTKMCWTDTGHRASNLNPVQRKNHFESAALALSTRDDQAPAMTVDNVLDDGKTKTRAPFFT
jgi:hypothetical protein